MFNAFSIVREVAGIVAGATAKVPAIENRFHISEELKPLNREKISNGFCSIIIEPKYKNKILRDLSYIGFRADYIYPELEYTAQEIKRRFE